MQKIKETLESIKQIINGEGGDSPEITIAESISYSVTDALHEHKHLLTKAKRDLSALEAKLTKFKISGMTLQEAENVTVNAKSFIRKALVMKQEIENKRKEVKNLEKQKTFLKEWGEMFEGLDDLRSES